MNEKLLTIAQTAEYLQCSQSTIRSRIRRGTLKAVKNGRIVRIPESELERFFQVPDTDAPPQPTAGEPIKAVSDAQQPDDTTEEPSDRPEWDGITGKK